MHRQEACIGDHVEMAPLSALRYFGFCDPSGGSNDSFTLAISHADGDHAIIDAVREIKPPFSPDAVIEEYATRGHRRFRDVLSEILSDITGHDGLSEGQVVAILIAEVETAIVAADKAAEMEREKALDPLASPDAAKARAAMEDAAFMRDRLRTVLPRLQQRLNELRAAEHVARWEPDFRQVEAKRDELAQEYAATYPKFVAQVVDLFSRAEAVDREVSRINGSAPPGEHRRLRQVELVARGLNNFSRADPPITKAVQLPDWTNGAKMAWPPAEPSLAVQVATSMTFSQSGDWWQQREERTAALRAEQERVAAFYEAQARRPAFLRRESCIASEARQCDRRHLRQVRIALDHLTIEMPSGMAEQWNHDCATKKQ
jgi:hypothetical protein